MNWNEIQRMLERSSNNVKIVRAHGADDVAARMGVNRDSTLGQVISNTKEIYINRYLRLCGSANIEKVNMLVKRFHPGKKVVVATDAWGGLFAISNGDFPGHEASVWYYAPDLLEWEDLELNYSTFVEFACGETVDEYYMSFMWPDMDKLLAGSLGGLIGGVNSDHALMIYPFLWSEECNIETAKKTIDTLENIVSFYAMNEKKLKE